MPSQYWLTKLIPGAGTGTGIGFGINKLWQPQHTARVFYRFSSPTDCRLNTLHPGFGF